MHDRSGTQLDDPVDGPLEGVVDVLLAHVAAMLVCVVQLAGAEVGVGEVDDLHAMYLGRTPSSRSRMRMAGTDTSKRSASAGRLKAGRTRMLDHEQLGHQQLAREPVGLAFAALVLRTWRSSP